MMHHNIEDYPIQPTAPKTQTFHHGATSDSSITITIDCANVYTLKLATSNCPLGMDFHLDHYYYNGAMKIMHELYKTNTLTDVTLRVESDSIKCHRIVLSACSPYFRAMFTGDMCEAKMHEIPLYSIPNEILRKLIEFAYTGSIHIGEQDVCVLLTCSSMLQMTHVFDACCQFLEHQLDPSNVIGILNFAIASCCEHLLNTAQTFLDRNFVDVVKHDEFLSFTFTQLMQTIKRDKLNVRSETEVYNAVVRWVNYDRSARLSVLTDALAMVRCHIIPPNFLRSQIKNCDLLFDRSPAKAYLISVLQDLIGHKPIPDLQRAAGHCEVIYSAGGYLRYSLNQFTCYNPSTNQWHRLSDMPRARSGLSACSLRGSIYLVGGRNNNERSSSGLSQLDCYDPLTDVWWSCAPMSCARNRVAVGVLDDQIFAIGGSAGALPLSSCEAYDPDLDRWTPIASMQERRIGPGVAVLNRLLYVVGGFGDGRRLATVERYDPDLDTWEQLADLNRARSGAGVVAVDGYIYAVGGYDSRSQLRTVERYDVKCNRWEYRASMIHSRSALSASVYKNEIWVSGGYDGTEFLSSIEVYNPATDQWTERAFMDSAKSGHAIVVCIAGSRIQSDAKTTL